MTPKKFAEYVRYKTKTNSTTFPDAEILAYMEVRQEELAQAIVKVDEDILFIPQSASLVANQREYPFPPDILAGLKRVEAQLDGTNWLKLTEMDISGYDKPLDEANIILNFANLKGQCFYDIIRKSIYILSGTIIDVASGLKVWGGTWPAPITDLSSTANMSQDPSTTTHGIPRELHEIWARGVIIDWKESKEKPIPLNERELKYEVDKKKAINTLIIGNRDKEVLAPLPPASDRGNEGEDY